MKCTDKNHERAIKTNCLSCACEEAISIGQEFERERIIKILENAQVTEAELYDGRIIKVKCESVRADLLIALIKGENK